MQEHLGTDMPLEAMAVDAIRRSMEGNDAKPKMESSAAELLDFSEEVSPPGWKDTLEFTMVPIVGLAQLFRRFVSRG